MDENVYKNRLLISFTNLILECTDVFYTLSIDQYGEFNNFLRKNSDWEITKDTDPTSDNLQRPLEKALGRTRGAFLRVLGKYISMSL